MAPLAGPLLRHLRAALDPLPEVVSRIAATLDPNPPINVRDGGAIRGGVDGELDALRAIAHDSKTILAQIALRERERTGIGSLKLPFNPLFPSYPYSSKPNT